MGEDPLQQLNANEPASSCRTDSFPSYASMSRFCECDQCGLQCKRCNDTVTASLL
jgi:hypothetical protein